MSIPHAKPGEIIDVRPLGAALAHSKTETLLKTTSLEVIRIVLSAGKTIARHKVSGEITVQCLEGNVDLCVGEITRELTAGMLLYLEGGDEHSLHAEEDSSVLVTILLRHKTSTAK